MGKESQTRETIPSWVDVSLGHTDHSESTGDLPAGVENAILSVLKDKTTIEFKNSNILPTLLSTRFS